MQSLSDAGYQLLIERQMKWLDEITTNLMILSAILKNDHYDDVVLNPILKDVARTAREVADQIDTLLTARAPRQGGIYK